MQLAKNFCPNYSWFMKMPAVERLRPHIFSDLYRRSPLTQRLFPTGRSTFKAACGYVKERIRSRDRGSNFGSQTRYYSWLPAFLLIPLLKKTGRDGILLENESENAIVASCFFHVHDDNTVHSFSYYCHPEVRGQGCGRILVELFLNHAREILDFSDPEKRPPCARIFGGGSQAMENLYSSLRRRQDSLGIQCFEKITPKVQETGWVRFEAPPPVLTMPGSVSHADDFYQNH